MLSKLRKQITVAREQLNYLLATHRLLLAQCLHTPPNPIELSALAALLHSFYTGIENIFKRVALELDGALLRGESWHRELLDPMAQPGATRGAVISAALRARWREYLGFRHVFRQAYAFQLRWEKMAALVREIEPTLLWLERELDANWPLGEEAAKETQAEDQVGSEEKENDHHN